MRLRTSQLSFGKKVLLLAIALVTVLQLGTLVPVLGTVRQDTEDTADRSVRLAGIVFDEYMRSRVAQLKTTVDVLAADFPFRNAVASRDRPTIESALANHAARAGTETAVVYDLGGNVIASTGVATDVSITPARPRIAADDAPADSIDGVTFLDGSPFLTITVPVRAPVTIAWVMLGFPIDADFVSGIARLTELEVSIVSFDLDGVTVYASTLAPDAVAAAFDDVALGDATLASSAGTGHPYITALRPFLKSAGGLYAALQLPRDSVVASYERIRNALVAVTVLALLLAIVGAIWISRMVSRPVRELADAARRMQEGIYNEPINSHATDEFGDLAAGFNAMQEAIANRERDIFHIAHHDSLSGLPARDLVVSRLRDALDEHQRLAVVSISISRFHDIASSLGHGTADQVIRHAAELLRATAGESTLLGHLSQHEFVLVIPDADADRAGELIVSVRERLRAGIKLPTANISLQIAAGVALFPDHRQDAPELLRCAAIARTNTARHTLGIGVYEPDQDEKARRLVRIVGDLPDALKNRELEVVYQPRIDVATGNVAGAEALVRWNHPELGRLNPAEFVTAIERAGGIMHLTRYVLTEAATQCALWQSRGIDVPMSINISVDDLEDEYLPYFLLDLSSRRQLEPGRITLEVTESAIMHNIETSLAVITCMRELGFRLAIDDFGTGQASLTQLKRIPADELKIDKSFVQNLDHPHDEAIVRAAIELAHQFGLEAVAEGVESASSLERLRALGCELAQGYHFARPLAPEVFEAWLAEWAERDGADLVRMARAGS